MNAPDRAVASEGLHATQGFHYLTDAERALLSDAERYAYDECCSNQPQPALAS